MTEVSKNEKAQNNIKFTIAWKVGIILWQEFK